MARSAISVDARGGARRGLQEQQLRVASVLAQHALAASSAQCSMRRLCVLAATALVVHATLEDVPTTPAVSSDNPAKDMGAVGAMGAVKHVATATAVAKPVMATAVAKPVVTATAVAAA